MTSYANGFNRKSVACQGELCNSPENMIVLEPLVLCQNGFFNISLAPYPTQASASASASPLPDTASPNANFVSASQGSIGSPLRTAPAGFTGVNSCFSCWNCKNDSQMINQTCYNSPSWPSVCQVAN